MIGFAGTTLSVRSLQSLTPLLLTLVMTLTVMPAGAADPSDELVGKVLAVRGIMTVEHLDGSVVIAGKGDPLFRGDTLSTGDRGFAIIEFTDGSRLTLRHGTRFALEEYDARPEKPSIATRLMRGGIRAITGWISKQRHSGGFEVRTRTAVMGIRGTEFDARLCEGDCSGEVDPAQAAAAQPQDSDVVGRVVAVTGHLVAMEPTGRARGLMTGAAVLRDDALETGSGSHAVIAFRDGSRITLQADSTFLVDDYRYSRNKPDETPSAFFRLVRGGFRMLTGAIAKRRPDRFRVSTPTAVAGVRGTGFDMALCKAPCRQKITDPNTVVARVLSADGPFSAVQQDGNRRKLTPGENIFQGDILQTGTDTVAVVVFKDDSRVSLQPRTRFEVSRYRYAGQDEESGVFRLYRGGVRMLTGWLAKRTKQYTVETATAVVGVRGTGFDLLCSGPCAGEGPADSAGAGNDGGGLVARVWEGTIAVANDSGETLVGTGNIVQVTSLQSLPVVLPQAPPVLDQLPAPRPDQLKVDLKSLFSAVAPGGEPPAVIVNTWEGEVALETESGETVSIRPGDTVFYAGGAAIPVQLDAPPAFMQQSPAPRPDKVPVDSNQLFGVSAAGSAGPAQPPALTDASPFVSETPPEAMARASTESNLVNPGLYVSVYDGDVTISTDEGEITLGKGESGFADFKSGMPVRLAVQPLFQRLDAVPAPTTDTRRLETMVPILQDSGSVDSRKEPECEIR